MNCRGDKRRKEIVSDYQIVSIGHYKLLDGIEIHSDAGNTMTDEYFIFRCIPNDKSKTEEMIYCGRPTAKELSRLSGCELKPIFNPLHTIGKGGGSCTVVGEQASEWNAMRKQLYNATNLLIMIKGNRPDKALFRIKSDIEEYPHIEPPIWLIKSVNTILEKYHTTMQHEVDELKTRYDLKEYAFNLLADKLDNEGVAQYFIP